jgi:hypothetical protein
MLLSSLLTKLDPPRCCASLLVEQNCWAQHPTTTKRVPRIKISSVSIVRLRGLNRLRHSEKRWPWCGHKSNWSMPWMVNPFRTPRWMTRLYGIVVTKWGWRISFFDIQGFWGGSDAPKSLRVVSLNSRLKMNVWHLDWTLQSVVIFS